MEEELKRISKLCDSLEKQNKHLMKEIDSKKKEIKKIW